MKTFVIEIIQSPVGWIKLLLISFFTYGSGICVIEKRESDSRQNLCSNEDWGVLAGKTSLE